MIKIAFPPYGYKIKQVNGKEMIFDACRKIWVILSPEEWVRQNFLQYLVQEKKYPAALIAVEREIALGDTRKRFDIVVFKNTQPWMVIECKEMDVPLSEAVIAQILNYNITLQAQYLVITNGTSTFAVQLVDGKFQWLDSLPNF